MAMSTLMKIGLGTVGAGVVAATGVSTAALVEVHHGKVEDMKNLLNQKSDISDDIIDMHDDLILQPMVDGWANVPLIMSYKNEETKQQVGMFTVDVTNSMPSDLTNANNKTTIKYHNRLNVLARLQKRGEAFIGTMHANDQIDYDFLKLTHDAHNTITETSVKKVTFAADGDGGKYIIETTEDNEKINFRTEGGTVLKVNDVPVSSFTINKTDLFPDGNIPSVRVTIRKDKYIDPTQKEEVLIIDYKAHVGYAFNRGIQAASALYDFIDKQMKELERQITHHTHPVNGATTGIANTPIVR